MYWPALPGRLDRGADRNVGKGRLRESADGYRAVTRLGQTLVEDFQIWQGNRSETAG